MVWTYENNDRLLIHHSSIIANTNSESLRRSGYIWEWAFLIANREYLNVRV